MTELLLLRHALSEWNAEGRWQGHADPPLSEVGREQARRAGARLAGLTADSPFTKTVSSDLRRAAETAELLAGELGIPGPIALDPNLREYDIGDWSGLTRSEIDAGWPGQIEAWDQRRQPGPPGGETSEAFARRVLRAAERVARAASPDSRLLVVAHGHFLRSLLETLDAPSRRFGNLSGVWFTTTGRGLSPSGRVNLLDEVARADETL